MRGMGAGSPGCRVPGARAALEAAGSARPSGTRLCLSDGATGWTGSGPEHSRLPRSPGPLGLAPLAALPVLHLSSSDQALPPLLHPPLWGVSSGAPPPLQALGTWGRDWDTGEHENGAGTVILFPIGSPSRPSAPAPSGPGPAPSGPTGCPSGLGPWSPHCLFLLPGRLEATQPRLPGGRSSAVHGPVLPRCPSCPSHKCREAPLHRSGAAPRAPPISPTAVGPSSGLGGVGRVKDWWPEAPPLGGPLPGWVWPPAPTVS